MALIDRIKAVLACQRHQCSEARRSRRMRRLHHPAQRRIAAQSEEHRFGNQATVALTQCRMQAKETRQQHIRRTVEFQYHSKRCRKRIDDQ